MSILPLPALETQRCTKCERLFPATSECFQRDPQKANNLHSWCRDCIRAGNRRNARVQRASGYKNKTQLRIAALREEVSAIKLARGCESPSCLGHPAHPAVLDFDHLPGFAKSADVAALIPYGRREEVLAEVAKCRVVCANCHRLSTAQRPELQRGKPLGSGRAPALVPLPEPIHATTVLPLPDLETLERSA